MKNATVEKVMKQIGETAERIKSDQDQTIDVMDIGDEVRQGDLYITMIAGLPKNAKAGRVTLQLAPGTTQGSRHTLRSLAGVTIYELKNAGPLDGPILVCEQGCTIDHPEHGNRTLPAGTYAITYQRAYADELRRVQD